MAQFPVQNFFAPYVAYTIYGAITSDPDYDKGNLGV